MKRQEESTAIDAGKAKQVLDYINSNLYLLGDDLSSQRTCQGIWEYYQKHNTLSQKQLGYLEGASRKIKKKINAVLRPAKKAPLHHFKVGDRFRSMLYGEIEVRAISFNTLLMTTSLKGFIKQGGKSVAANISAGLWKPVK